MESRPQEWAEHETRPAVLFVDACSACGADLEFKPLVAPRVIAVPDTDDLKRDVRDDEAAIFYLRCHGAADVPSEAAGAFARDFFEHHLTGPTAPPVVKLQELLRAYPRPRSLTTMSSYDIYDPVVAPIAMTVPVPVRTSEAYRAAIAAARDWLDGDKTAPARFAGQWLGMSPRNADFSAEAVATALMEDWWTTAKTWSGDAVLKEIKRRTQAARLALRPLWERQTNGETVMLLSHRIGGEDGPLTMADVVPDPAGSAEEQALAALPCLDDPCISVVFAGLTDDEARVATEYAMDADIDWVQAALRAEAPEHFGRRVKKKLARLGRLHRERARSAAATARAPRCPHALPVENGGQQ
ncbi:hypothetical protein [Streptomyces sp. NPDC093591]|uniref:hypothetical protein n=1 Tax=Streptomyces sp. NPDC093591 TaxID=3366044 RepID=UPI003826245F